MQEIELKFQVPEAALGAVTAALKPRGRPAPPRTRLQAIYFDTQDRLLASNGVALRLRKEGRRWVQTLKAQGHHAMQRLEHEVPIALASGLRPGVDPGRHAGTEAGERLMSLLSRPDGGPVELMPIFSTDIWRRSRQVRTARGSVELALDEGWIEAQGRKLPVRELEIELLRGQPQAVLLEARRWVQHHGLWLDTRTKAHRGEHLARASAAAPAKIVLPKLAAGVDVAEAGRALQASVLEGILANASPLAGDDASAEHVHQLRVGLRRLRGIWQLLDGHADLPDEAARQAAVALFRTLGLARDRDVLHAFLPTLQASGSPVIDVPRHARHAPDPGAVLRDPAVTLLWLDLLTVVLPPQPGKPEAGAPHAGQADMSPAALPSPPFAPLATERLRAWYRKCVKQALAFDDLDDEARHTLRKRLKRLRYGIDCMAPLLPTKAVRAHLKALRPAQDALGEFNDMATAHQLLTDLARSHPEAWFAIGWIAGRRDALLARASAALETWTQAPKFWK